MAPSTSNPTDLHRAPVACLPCRKAKVRCLVSARRERCDRCIANSIQCAFVQPKRTRVRQQPYPSSSQRGSKTSTDYNQDSVCESVSNINAAVPSEAIPSDSGIDVNETCGGQRASPSYDRQQQRPQHEQPIITSAMRARIIAALATLKGKRGAPFTFVTSGDSPTFNTGSNINRQLSQNVHDDQRYKQSQLAPPSLNLSKLLQPLRVSADRETNDDEFHAGAGVRMPTYVSAMTLGQTITDPIEGGIISSHSSQALFEYFMLHMNAKWEYILDPHVDSHYSVRRRSPLLFTCVLFCSSKFANYVDGHIVSETDPFLQSRLCGLSRNLVIKSLAAGDKSIETMQALYLLACWKDADDDVSYLHSGYAFGVLRDFGLESGDGDGRQVSRCRRTWLALVRQDRQQSMFFVRKASPSQSDGEVSFLTNPETWLEMPGALPFDFVAACSADLRHIQSKLRALVQDGSPLMLPCLQEHMDAELAAWRRKWTTHIQKQDKAQMNHCPSINPGLIDPGVDHLAILMEVWEHSVRLNVASVLLRQGLFASVMSGQRANGHSVHTLLDIDLTTIQPAISSALPGLSSSIKGAFGTLQNLMKFPAHDLRRAPDTILLLAPSAALFLCLLLCLPPNGILGPAFQGAAVDLVRGIARHIEQCVQSAHDTVALHSTYLKSLVELLKPLPLQGSGEPRDHRSHPTFELSMMDVGTNGSSVDAPGLQVAPEDVDQCEGRDTTMPQGDDPPTSPSNGDQNLHFQTLVNLLDGDLFWDMPPGAEDTNNGLSPTSISQYAFQR